MEARQVEEARLIDAFVGEFPINNKQEFGHNARPALAVDDGQGGGPKRVAQGQGGPKSSKRATADGGNQQGAHTAPQQEPPDEKKEHREAPEQQKPMFQTIQTEGQTRTRRALTVKEILAQNCHS